MINAKSDFLKILQERGFLYQCTNLESLDDLLQKQKISAYIGFDCTADSLHVGSLIQIMILRWLEKTGNRPIVLLGGATTKIGDPSGKDESRPALTDEVIANNMKGIANVFKQFNLSNATMVNNEDWLGKISYMQIMAELGRHFSVNRMITQDSVKTRLDREQEMTFLEFNYMIFQAYDFYELSRQHNCRLQIGGSDQWGNIVMGVDLNRRKRHELDYLPAWKKTKGVVGGEEKKINEHNKMHEELYKKHVTDHDVFGLTTPLLTTSEGKKMGKTADGAVWLTENKFSAYDYWQFWRNTTDADVIKFLKLFTELPMSEIEKLSKLQGSEINEVKKILANEATKLCHGEEAAKRAAETAIKTFEQGGYGAALPIIEVPKAELEVGIPAYSIILKAGLSTSGSEARKLIRGKGGRVNDKQIADENEKISLKDLNSEGMIKLSSGKKNHALIKPV